MLKTNTKKARQNLQAYIVENFNGENYEIETPATFQETALVIYETFKKEKYYSNAWEKAHRIPEQESFIEWCAGLPSILDTCYYYNRSAVDDLGEILEETEEEKARFTEDKAENLLTRLIYSEIKKAVAAA